MTKPPFYVHPNAIVDTDNIGANTRIWAFTHVMQGAVIGSNCNIGEQCFVENHVSIGDDVVIKNGVALWEGVTLESGVFVGPSAVFTNDRTPRAKLFRESVPTLVSRGASVGANATVRCGIRIGRWALVGAGAVVTRDVPDFAIVVGNPARIHGYACCCGERLEFDQAGASTCGCGCSFRRSDGKVELVMSSPRIAAAAVGGAK